MPCFLPRPHLLPYHHYVALLDLNLYEVTTGANQINKSQYEVSFTFPEASDSRRDWSAAMHTRRYTSIIEISARGSTS